MDPPDDPGRTKVLDLTVRRGEHGDIDEDEPVDPSLWVIRSRPTKLGNTDWMRGLIALILMTTFSAVALGSVVLIAFAQDADKVVKALALVFSALTGLTGAVSGFYFGGRR